MTVTPEEEQPPNHEEEDEKFTERDSKPEDFKE